MPSYKLPSGLSSFKTLPAKDWEKIEGLSDLYLNMVKRKENKSSHFLNNLKISVNQLR